MSNNSKAAAIVSNGCHLKGDLTLSGPLHVNGVIEGHIRSTNIVIVGASGKVTGDIHASSIMINGNCIGTIRTNRLEVLDKGQVSGSVYCDNCSITRGGLINGKVFLGNNKDKPQNKEVMTYGIRKKRKDPGTDGGG